MPIDLNILEEVGEQIVAKGRNVPKRWAKRVVTYGRKLAPRRTGYLQEHIVDASGEAGEGEGVAESQADYSSAVNFGTVYMGAQPYFTNAIEQATGEMGEIIGEEFGI